MSERSIDRKGKRKVREDSGSGRDLLDQVGKGKEKAVETRETGRRAQKKRQRSKSSLRSPFGAACLTPNIDTEERDEHDLTTGLTRPSNAPVLYWEGLGTTTIGPWFSDVVCFIYCQLYLY